jgi:CBS domain-containing protein
MPQSNIARMKAVDLMTSPVIAVTPRTQVGEIAALLVERGISGVPVLDDGKVVGMVGETELLHRHEIGTDAPSSPRSWWARFFAAEESPRQYVRARGTRASDVMTHAVVSVDEAAPAAAIAQLLAERGIRRVTVMRGETLIGIVTRANLVKALAVQARRAQQEPGDDTTIRNRLLEELDRHSWWRGVYSGVTVTGGVVCFYGLIESDAERRAARVAAENVVGVRRVEDRRVNFYDSYMVI